ncbi:hypothetical protein TcG_11670 [Trypanosoma cruzi]|nr:hypothetical protein TcG_11670 [Trypanosoma cruzi]
MNSARSRLSPGEAMCVLCVLLLRRTRLVPFRSSRLFWAVTAVARDMALSCSYDTTANFQTCGHGGKECFTQRNESRPIRFAQGKGGFLPSRQRVGYSRSALIHPHRVRY